MIDIQITETNSPIRYTQIWQNVCRHFVSEGGAEWYLAREKYLLECNGELITSDIPFVIRFANEEDAIAFKLKWS